MAQVYNPAVHERIQSAQIYYLEDFKFLLWHFTDDNVWCGPQHSGLDIETEGKLNPHDGEIATVQIELGGECWVVHWDNSLTLKQIPYNHLFRRYLETTDVVKVIHNAKFETMWLTQAFGWDLHIRNAYDTMAGAYILAEGAGEDEDDWFKKPKLGLDDLVYSAYRVEMDKDKELRIGFRRKGNYVDHASSKKGSHPLCSDCMEPAEFRVGSTDACATCIDTEEKYYTKAGKPRARKPIDSSLYTVVRELKGDLSERELNYAAFDSLWASQLYLDQKKEMERLQREEGENYLALVRLDSDVACVLGRMELRGIPVNREELECLDAEWITLEQTLREDILNEICFEGMLSYLAEQGEDWLTYEDMPERLGYWKDPTENALEKWEAQNEEFTRKGGYTTSKGQVTEAPKKPESKWVLAKDFPNLGSGEQMEPRLRELGIPVPSYESHELRHYADNPLVKKILEWKVIVKLQGTYSSGFMERINPNSQRIHGGFNQFVTCTGRLSAVNPNLQNMPSKGEFASLMRGVVQANANLPVGAKKRKLVIIDYSQIELRLIAEMYNDIAMQNAYNEGLDLHTYFAARIMGVSYEELKARVDAGDKEAKATRSQAKPANFGLGYGAGVDQFMFIAWAQYYMILSREEATRIRAVWLQTWSGIAAFHEKMKKDLREGTGPVKFRTQMGRTRKMPRTWTNKKDKKLKSAYAAGLNHPVQGTGADGFKLAMARMDEELRPFTDCYLIVQVHDEIIIECNEDEAEMVKFVAECAMIEEMQQFLKTVPCEVDGHIEDRWTKG